MLTLRVGLSTLPNPISYFKENCVSTNIVATEEVKKSLLFLEQWLNSKSGWARFHEWDISTTSWSTSLSSTTASSSFQEYILCNKPCPCYSGDVADAGAAAVRRRAVDTPGGRLTSLRPLSHVRREPDGVADHSPWLGAARAECQLAQGQVLSRMALWPPLLRQNARHPGQPSWTTRSMINCIRNRRNHDTHQGRNWIWTFSRSYILYNRSRGWGKVG